MVLAFGVRGPWFESYLNLILLPCIYSFVSSLWTYVHKTMLNCKMLISIKFCFFLFEQQLPQGLKYPHKVALLEVNQSKNRYKGLYACEKYFVNSLPHNPDFKQPRRKSLLKTLWKKEKILVTSIFSFSQNVFYPSQNKF